MFFISLSLSENEALDVKMVLVFVRLFVFLLQLVSSSFVIESSPLSILSSS